MGDSALREVLRTLLLPIRPDLEGSAVEAAAAKLGVLGVDAEEHGPLLRLEIEEWRSSGDAPGHLREAVAEYLAAGDPDFGESLGAHYFKLHDEIGAEPLFDHEVAAAFLSHARTMASLARDDHMSSAQIARVIAARDSRVPTSWQLVDRVLRALNLQRSVSEGQVAELFQFDQDAEVEVFADADDRTCIEMVAAAGGDLGVGIDLRPPLMALMGADEEPFVPYLQMLHLLGTIAEFHDHDLRAIYEFNPRGHAASALFSYYPAALAGSGNPFLNNAKSVDRLDRGWARSKRSAQAHSLVTVVTALSEMGFAARRELCAWIRRLLLRLIRSAEDTEMTIPPLGAAEIGRLLESVARGPSETYGILEQRMVDAVAALRHPVPDWVGRGLGDSVNATNISRRKCGDCDFQRVADLQVSAYEPHAGRLTDVYVSEHKRTLGRVLEARAAEWDENFGEGLTWRVSVKFVAHEVAASLPQGVTYDAVEAEITAVTFADFLADVDPGDPAVQASFASLVRDPLNERRTPDVVRIAVGDLI